MADPLSNDEMLASLKAAGIKLREISGWRTHERDDETGKVFGPVNGIVIHHTAGTDSLNVCRNGRTGLPGPLCHAHAPKDGTINLISNGRANHGGTFAQNAHDAVVAEADYHPYPDSAEPVDANDRYYGIEVENLGNGSDWYPTVQYNAVVRWAAAICKAHGWSANSVIGHKEGTRRKPDPRGPVGSAAGPNFDMNKFRRDVQAVIDGATPSEEDMPLTDADAKRVWNADFVKAPVENPDNPTWAPSSYLRDTNLRTRNIEALVKAQAATIDRLVDAIAAGPGADVEALKAEIRSAVAGAVESLDVRLDVTP